jgi:hypothetical protein
MRLWIVLKSTKQVSILLMMCVFHGIWFTVTIWCTSIATLCSTAFYISLYVVAQCAVISFCSSLILANTKKCDIYKSVHHHTIQINQPTRCTSFQCLLLDIYVWLNMFRASFRPSSGAYDCIRSLWFYRWRVAVGALLVVVWQVIDLPDHDQQRSECHSPTVKPEAPNAVVRCWW